MSSAPQVFTRVAGPVHCIAASLHRTLTSDSYRTTVCALLRLVLRCIWEMWWNPIVCPTLLLRVRHDSRYLFPISQVPCNHAIQITTSSQVCLKVETRVVDFCCGQTTV